MAWRITRRELREIVRDHNLLLPIVFMPSLMGLLAGMSAFGSRGGAESTVGVAIGAVAFQTASRDALAGLSNLPAADQVATIELLLKAVGIPLFWIIPLALTSAVAADSFVGEKERETIEPLLATPIRNAELFTGKVTTAIIPAILGGWLGMAIFTALVALSGTTFYPKFLLSDGDWMISTFVIIPLMALLAAGLAALISTRVSSYRAAYQLNGLVILPIILLMIPQTIVLFLVTPAALVFVSIGLALLDVLVIVWALLTFDRERLLGAR